MANLPLSWTRNGRGWKSPPPPSLWVRITEGIDSQRRAFQAVTGPGPEQASPTERPRPHYRQVGAGPRTGPSTQFGRKSRGPPARPFQSAPYRRPTLRPGLLDIVQSLGTVLLFSYLNRYDMS